jgi:hypothetical protein
METGRPAAGPLRPCRLGGNRPGAPWRGGCGKLPRVVRRAGAGEKAGRKLRRQGVEERDVQRVPAEAS